MATCKHNKSAAIGWSRVTVAVLLSACAGPAARPPAAAPVEVVEVAPEQGMPSPALIRTLAAIEVKIEDYPVPGSRRSGWQYRLRRARSLAEQGQLEQAQEESRRLHQDVSEASRHYFQQQARRYLEGIRQFARLKRSHRDKRRAMEFAFARQDYRRAYHGSRSLYRQLWSAQAWVTVRAGDTLAGIAAREEIYDNPNLWPLLQQANKGLVRDPRRLKIGWRLRYPLHPTLDEIFAAVKIAAGQ